LEGAYRAILLGSGLENEKVGVEAGIAAHKPKQPFSAAATPGGESCAEEQRKNAKNFQFWIRKWCHQGVSARQFTAPYLAARSVAVCPGHPEGFG